MCGICGFFDSLNSQVPPLAISRMTNVLRHRGPDDEGYIAVSTREGIVTPLRGKDSRVSFPNISDFTGRANLYMAHRRLAIIDTSPAGHQPMSYDNENLWITYNGELYNYQALYRDLSSLGHRFKTQTDTEVLLAAYEEWGIECLNRIDGMWAFVIYDKKRNLLFGSRDRFGVKPLYFIKDNNFFAFASETKAFQQLPEFKKTICPKAVFEYLSFSIEHWDDGSTFFEEVQELPSSHAFLLDITQQSFKVFRYYELSYDEERVWEPFSEKKAASYINTVREAVASSIKRHLLADVPVGACLSGGIDSSSIVCLVEAIIREKAMAQVGSKLRAFTACYHDPKIDESSWAQLVTEKTETEWYVTYPQGEELIEDLEDLIYTQDFPFGSTSIYAQYRVMKLAKQQGITVLLDGQGGDELFTGYAPYYTTFFREMIGKQAWKDLLRELHFLENSSLSKIDLLKNHVKTLAKKFLPRNIKRNVYRKRNAVLKYLPPSSVQCYLNQCLEEFAETICQEETLNKMLFNLMTSHSLPTLLRYEDRNSMRFQIESRTPFADDRNLIETVFAIPAVYKIHKGFSKWLLRESMKPFLPKEIYLRRDKIGFATPEYSWLYPHFDCFRSLLSEDLSDFLQVEKLKKEWDVFVKQQPRYGTTAMWRIINFALWNKIVLK